MIINKTKYLEFKCAKSPSGTDWHYVKRTNDKNTHDSAVVITTVIKTGSKFNFLFLKTRRPPIYWEKKAVYCLESPAGLIGDENSSETLLECAKKELLEETGYETDKMFIELQNSSTSAGLTSESLSFITAIVEDKNTKIKPIDDNGIIIDRILVPINDVNAFISSLDKEEYTVSTALIAGIYFAVQRIKC